MTFGIDKFSDDTNYLITKYQAENEKLISGLGKAGALTLVLTLAFYMVGAVAFHCQNLRNIEFSAEIGGSVTGMLFVGIFTGGSFLYVYRTYKELKMEEERDSKEFELEKIKPPSTYVSFPSYEHLRYISL